MSLSVVKKNIIANFAGNGWAALLAVVLIPVYIDFLGIEAWGIIGVFISLQTLAMLLDLGLSTTLNREMARLSLQPGNAQEMRNLVRTFELIYWGFAAIIGASIFALAPLIANRWLHGNQLSPETITNAIRLMGLAITVQWPFALYSGGLLGLQRQALLSGLNAVIATVRGVGAVLVLSQVSPTLRAFFVWQVVIGLVQTCLAGWLLWRSLPHTGSLSGFQRELLQTRWRFAAGMIGITVMSLVITHTDKVILSRLLNLQMFGYYVLASSVAASLYLVVGPVFLALYPKLTQLVSLGDQEGLKEIYHHGTQLMSVLIIPISTVIVFFSKEILFVWTGNSTTADQTHLVLSILIAGTALNGLLHLPYALQLAHGWTRLTFFINVVSVVVLMPSIILMASWYGVIGAASIWVTFNLSVLVVGVQLMHHRILQGEQWKWYVEDIGLPFAVSLGAALICLVLAPRTGSRFQLLMVVASVTVFVVGSTFLATPVTRLAAVEYLRFKKVRVFNQS